MDTHILPTRTRYGHVYTCKKDKTQTYELLLESQKIQTMHSFFPLIFVVKFPKYFLGCHLRKRIFTKITQNRSIPIYTVKYKTQT